MTEQTNESTLTTSEGTGGYNNKPLNQFKITTVTLSAVEWLQEQYNQCPKYEERIYEQDWEKAKAMEKEQRRYSEEEVTQLLIKFNQEIQEVENVREWFEQFKKK